MSTNPPDAALPTSLIMPGEEEDEDGAPASVPAGAVGAVGVGGKAARPVARTKKGKTKGAKITGDFWVEMRQLYEMGRYSQRDLVNWAKSQGVEISQSAISRRAFDEEWIKGSKLDELAEKMAREQSEKLGTEILAMVDRHLNTTKAMQGELVAHLKRAAELRKLDPNYSIPVAQLVSLTNALDALQKMEARAMGFDFRTGETVVDKRSKENNAPSVLHISVMDEAQEQEIQRRAEAGDEEDEE